MMKLSGFGAAIGWFIGLHGMLAFTFIAEPGEWLFTTWSTGRAIMAYGYLCILMILLPTAIGAGLPGIWRAIFNRGHRA